MATADTTVNPLTGLAACCNDPQNRRTSTLDPAHVAAAKGGIPGVQLCAVCGRRHFTFTVTPQGQAVADDKLTALSALSVPALEDLSYIVDDPSGTPVSNKVTHTRLGGLYVPGICEGRLTLSNGNPVSATDITGATTIYWNGYKGNRVGLYDGTRWNLYEIGSAKSFALGTLTNAKNYDLFVYDNAGTLTLEASAAWSNDTTRTDALTLQNNVLVKSAATTRRYLGTFRTTATTTTEDSGGDGTTQVGGKRFLWNYYWRVPRYLCVVDLTNTWTYTTASWRVADGATAPLNCVEYVCGIAEDAIEARLIVNASCASGAFGYVGIGVDGSAPAAMNRRSALYTTGGIASALVGDYVGIPGQGYHTLQWLENGDSSPAGLTFQGDNGAGLLLSGLSAMVMA